MMNQQPMEYNQLVTNQQSSAEEEITSSPIMKTMNDRFLLPEDFEPSQYTVVIGRGKRAREAHGNRRLRVLAMSLLTNYADAVDSKIAKTRLVKEVVEMVKNACSERRNGSRCRGMAFVRLTKDGALAICTPQ